MTLEDADGIEATYSMKISVEEAEKNKTDAEHAEEAKKNKIDADGSKFANLLKNKFNLT